MTTRPSDRALSKALEELRENATVSRDVLRAFDWIERRAREIDAKPVEGLLPCPCGNPRVMIFPGDSSGRRSVACNDQECRFSISGYSDEQLAAAWNRREGRGND